MNKPYIRKYGEIKGYLVYIVDGKYIRNEINEEFTNFGIYPRFKFIPKKEFWIDKEYGKVEDIKFYLKNLLIEEELMKKGMDYDSAFERGDKAEMEFRKKYNKMRKLSRDIVLKKLHLKIFEKYKGKMKIWIVDGSLVRDYFFIDFTEGGHDLVYKFVPKNEVWIDDDLNPRERDFVILHEIHERNLMKKGMDYNSAHNSSSKIEHHCRKNPELLKKRIKEEIEKYG